MAENRARQVLSVPQTNFVILPTALAAKMALQENALPRSKKLLVQRLRRLFVVVPGSHSSMSVGPQVPDNPFEISAIALRPTDRWQQLFTI